MSLNSNFEKKPPWLKRSLPTHQNYFSVSNLIKNKNLHTICRSARCPNIAECWAKKTATFLILGDTCTRNCGFCAVKKGSPSPLSSDEPEKVAEAVEDMGLRYAVITSVTRDDLPEGGAGHFVKTIQAVRKKCPATKIEVLIPDFGGDPNALQNVVQASPDIINHNLEVPEALYPKINRPKKNYKRSLELLRQVKDMGIPTKSGLMLGLGEKENDIEQTLIDLRRVSCDILTLGQYLQPTRFHLPVSRYYSPSEFNLLKKKALRLGFKGVESGPLVRSSYRAYSLYKKICRTEKEN